MQTISIAQYSYGKRLLPRTRKVPGRVGPKVVVGKNERALVVGRIRAFGFCQHGHKIYEMQHRFSSKYALIIVEMERMERFCQDGLGWQRPK